jgi:hypothetical protein
MTSPFSKASYRHMPDIPNIAACMLQSGAMGAEQSESLPQESCKEMWTGTAHLEQWEVHTQRGGHQHQTFQTFPLKLPLHGVVMGAAHRMHWRGQIAKGGEQWVPDIPNTAACKLPRGEHVYQTSRTPPLAICRNGRDGGQTSQTWPLASHERVGTCISRSRDCRVAKGRQ